ncbi:hypothetical protein Rhe02_18900 [Rhizocola hellebori]|uniref:WGR domain-containing protein n=2 Tax=Rhizocola hellebori TaxID=1392758 RepID=A0A8J3VFF1_9ACTN|nr:hypothetical protein Rhe02_18900 [Rhizocola hellebori]
MIKLYRRDADGVLHYHESWTDSEENLVVEHWGRVGERGESVQFEIPEGVSEDEAVEDMLAQARKDGFAELSRRDHRLIEVQYDLEDSWGTMDDLAVRNKVDALLNEELGWHGLGEWAGSSMGSGQMEIAYVVVDADEAIRVVTSALQASDLPMYSRINVQADEPDTD